MTTLELKSFDTALTARARELARTLAERNQIAIERSADDFDNGILAAGRESSAQALSQDMRMLRQVEAARDRLRDGTFGFCSRCEEEIAPKRLRAIPWATYCVSCQAKAEEGGALQVGSGGVKGHQPHDINPAGWLAANGRKMTHVLSWLRGDRHDPRLTPGLSAMR